MTEVTTTLGRAELEAQFQAHRVALTGYCYRMLGSAFEADDAVQETLVRAWRFADRFEGRSSVKTWLHRIATNVCFDLLAGRQRRARPMDLGPAVMRPTTVSEPLPEHAWLQPAPDEMVFGGSSDTADPAEQLVARESIRLAFVAALQYLPARQRAVLILCDVLRWKAAETAELLDTTVASVNSALQRARATLAEKDVHAGMLGVDRSARDAELLDRYVAAFERYDIDELVTLLRADVIMSMPPFNMWLQGADEVARWMAGPGAECAGSRVVKVRANGLPAFAQYRATTDPDRHEAWSLTVLEHDGEMFTGVHAFLDVAVIFPLFDLPLVLER